MLLIWDCVHNIYPRSILERCILCLRSKHILQVNTFTWWGVYVVMCTGIPWKGVHIILYVCVLTT